MLRNSKLKYIKHLILKIFLSQSLIHLERNELEPENYRHSQISQGTDCTLQHQLVLEVMSSQTKSIETTLSLNSDACTLISIFVNRALQFDLMYCFPYITQQKVIDHHFSLCRLLPCRCGSSLNQKGFISSHCAHTPPSKGYQLKHVQIAS